MIPFRAAFAACGLAMTLLLCYHVASHASQASERAAVHIAEAAFVKAYNAGQIENIVALYDENAVIYPPGASPVYRQAALRKFFSKDIPEFLKSDLVFTLDEKLDGGVSGHMAWSSGTWTTKDKEAQI